MTAQVFNVDDVVRIDNAFKVADEAALLALSAASVPPRVDLGIYCIENGGGSDVLQGRWAQYRASSDAPLGRNILPPVDGVGRWHLFKAGDASDITLQAVRDATYGVRDRIGRPTEPAPATATAAAALNGRLQWLSLEIGKLLNRIPPLGQQTKDASISVVLPTNADPLRVISGADLAVSSQTLSAPGISASIAMTDKLFLTIQLLWTGVTTDQVARAEGSFDGGTTWHPLEDSLLGQSFSAADITAYAGTGLHPAFRIELTAPGLTQVRVRWISGDGQLGIKAGAA